MSLRGRDAARYGPCFYAPVWKWEEDEGAISAMFTQANTPLNNIFGSIYYPVQKLNSSGEVTPQYLDCGIAPVGLKKDWMQLNQEKLVAFSYYPYSADGQTHSKDRMIAAINTVIDLNGAKYRRLAASMGFVYDPISNYDMTESGTDTKTPSGTKSKSHSVDTTKIGSITVTGAVDVQLGQNAETGQYEFTSIEFDDDATKKTQADGATDVRAKAQASRGNDGPTITTGDDVDVPTTKNYTTTMDSAGTGRLHGYNETLGSTAQGTYNDVTEDIPVMGQVTAGNPAFASYTDTESYTDYEEETEHELARSGNIGVTTTQQMIEQERNVVRYSVVKEFFEDLNKELLLSVWD